jgi:hypothetical protein
MNVDIKKTKSYYNSLSHDKLCDCDYCKLYYEKSREAYPDLAKWLEAYGIDIEKPFEAMSLETDEKGITYYIGVQYVVFGTCSEDYLISIGEVDVRFAKSHPDTGIKEEHFVLEASLMQLSLDR